MKTAVVQEVITQEKLDKALSYSAYRELIDNLMADNKTTGENHSEAMLNYTTLNMKRMDKWDKITKLTDAVVSAVSKIKEPQYWVVLTEAWCGDAAQNIPIINKIASLNENITIKFLLRDENLDIMDNYLTNGGRSIPKLIVLKANNLEELGTWGPRPAPVQEMLIEYKKQQDETYEEFAKRVHIWYAKDKTATAQSELEVLLNELI